MAALQQETEQTRLVREEKHEAEQRTRERNASRQLGLFAAGRVFLGAMFVASAGAMLADYSGTVASLQETLFDVRDVLPLALGLQLVAGLALAAGIKARVAAASLGLYLIAELLVAPPDLSSDLGRAVAFSHLGLLGALAMIIGHGAGLVSLDHLLEKRHRSRAAHHAGATVAPTL